MTGPDRLVLRVPEFTDAERMFELYSDPRVWGRGYVQEISAAAITAARRHRADLPVTAYLVEGNDRSLRAVERTGLTRVWRGPDAGNRTPPRSGCSTATRRCRQRRGTP